MKESQVITEFMKELQCAAQSAGEGLWYFKIPDMPQAMFGTDGKTRFNPGKAVDIVGGFKGGSFAIEWKLHKTTGAFAFDRVNERQVEFLRKVHFGGGVALIAITQFVKQEDMSDEFCSQVKPTTLVRGNLWRTFFIPILSWLSSKKFAEKELKRKSIPLYPTMDKILGHPTIYKINVNSKSVWDGQAALKFIREQKESGTAVPNNQRSE